MKDALDGRTTGRGRVLKKASARALQRWMAEDRPFSENFVVVQCDGGRLLRRDRYDLANEPTIPLKAYIVLKEPDLFIGAEFPEDYHQDDSEVTAKAVHDYMIDGAAPLAKA